MPELPEVEVVRRGLARSVPDRRIAAVEVFHPRAVRRHLAGDVDFSNGLQGRSLRCVSRRGKFLWLPTDDGRALVAHLGMSGQMLMSAPEKANEPHLRVRVTFTDEGTQLRFVDQRTFGGLALETLEPDGAGGHLPRSVTHIARDPLDPLFDDEVFVTRLLSRRTEIKRALLDQTLVSGIGNIYADEALWRSRCHGVRPTWLLTRPAVRRLLNEVRAVLIDSLQQGGTSFDALYVGVDGTGGWFQRSLAVYGREGEPCERCESPIRRERFMNRSSFFCPICQPRPRRKRVTPLDPPLT